ncbi:hypothetical protein B296_00056851 [Ensete ventricosum]|uniref:Uncharacterized protein n=1 Tax=Ensete ventricosum TaxID=4639 RepID=A0A426WXL1_ENSVE|nr:hypothetical protein B296_00056851 [Ensete ventricosum]
MYQTCASLPSRRWHCLLRLHQLSFRILPSPCLCRGTNHPAPSPLVHIVDHFQRSNFSNYVKGGRTRAALSDLLGHDIFMTTSGPSSAEQTTYRQKAPSLVDNSSTVATPKRPFAASPQRYSSTATTLS